MNREERRARAGELLVSGWVVARDTRARIDACAACGEPIADDDPVARAASYVDWVGGLCCAGDGPTRPEAPTLTVPAAPPEKGPENMPGDIPAEEPVAAGGFA